MKARRVVSSPKPAQPAPAAPPAPATPPGIPAGQALRTGTRNAARYWPIVLIFFAVNACAAASWTVPLQAALAPLLNRPAVWGAGGDLPIIAFSEHLSSLNRMEEVTATGAPEDLLPESALATLAAFAGLIVAGAAAVLLPGGTILAYREGAPSFSFRRFFWGMAHWSAPFLLLWLLEIVVTVLGWGIGVALVFFSAAAGAGACALLPGLALALGAPFLFGMTAEYARIVSVARDRRNPFAMLAVAWGMIWARPGTFVGIYCLGTVITLMILALYGYVLGPAIALAALPVMIAVQQAVALVRLIARLWRLAGETALIPPAAS